MGKSLRDALPENLWDRVAIGYYNCSEIALLNDVCAPHRTEPTEESAAVVRALGTLSFRESLEIEPRGDQVTITSKGPARIEHLRGAIQAALFDAGLRPQVVMSGHSVDVLAGGVTKTAMIAYLVERFGVASDSVLRVGDKGAVFGNDHALLKHALGLSVDEVSPDLASCWRFSPPGHFGPQALLGYLAALSGTNGVVRWKPAKMDPEVRD